MRVVREPSLSNTAEKLNIVRRIELTDRMHQRPGRTADAVVTTKRCQNCQSRNVSQCGENFFSGATLSFGVPGCFEIIEDQ